METTQLKITGMNCGACVNHVTHALQSVAGVQAVKVDLASASATVQHEPNTDRTALIQSVAEAGYRANRDWDAQK